ncbi:MAG: arsenate reductase [Patescibacteria group bacterium]|jgi:arsenate reductase
MSKKEKVQVYHNANCSKSNASCELLTEEGVDFETIEYLKTPLTKEDLIALLHKLSIPAPELVRKGEAEFKENYFGSELSEKEWIDAMLRFPNLIQRPIVVQGNKAVIGRPIERVIDLMRE